MYYMLISPLSIKPFLNEKLLLNRIGKKIYISISSLKFAFVMRVVAASNLLACTYVRVNVLFTCKVLPTEEH